MVEAGRWKRRRVAHQSSTATRHSQFKPVTGALETSKRLTVPEILFSLVTVPVSRERSMGQRLNEQSALRSDFVTESVLEEAKRGRGRDAFDFEYLPCRRSITPSRRASETESELLTRLERRRSTSGQDCSTESRFDDVGEYLAVDETLQSGPVWRDLL